MPVYFLCNNNFVVINFLTIKISYVFLECCSKEWTYNSIFQFIYFTIFLFMFSNNITFAYNICNIDGE